MAAPCMENYDSLQKRYIIATGLCTTVQQSDPDTGIKKKKWALNSTVSHQNPTRTPRPYQNPTNASLLSLILFLLSESPQLVWWTLMLTLPTDQVLVQRTLSPWHFFFMKQCHSSPLLTVGNKHWSRSCCIVSPSELHVWTGCLNVIHDMKVQATQ